MSSTNNDELDNTTFSVLLILSGGQKLPLRDIANISEQPIERVWAAIQTLSTRQLITSAIGKYLITFEGVEFLGRRGITATEPDEDPSNDRFRNRFKIIFFGSWSELLQWITFPLILFFVGLIVYFAYSVNPDQLYIGLLSAIAYFLIVTFLFFYIRKSYRSVGETEKMVVFRLGKCVGVRGSGPALIIPILDKPKIVDTREKSKEIKNEVCTTRNQILVNVGLLITWAIDDPVKSLMKMVEPEDTMQLFTIAVLRSVISEFNLEQALEARNGIGNIVRVRLERTVSEWGLTINSFQIRDMRPPEGVLERIQKRLIANIESETALTKTDTEVESLRRLFAIGSQLDERTFNLKYLETLTKVGEGPATKYVISMEFFRQLGDWLQTQINRTTQNR